MRANTTILAFLAKALKGNANQEPGDTKIVVPGSFLPVIRIPEIFVFLNSAPQATVAIKSLVQTATGLFNLTGTTLQCTLGPGLWEIEWALYINPLGAVNDLTSSVGLQITLAEGLGSTVDLARFTNTGLVYQALTGRFTALIPAEQNLQFFTNTIVGAGTGTNAFRARIIANRFL
jgi:hypothetical protein